MLVTPSDAVTLFLAPRRLPWVSGRRSSMQTADLAKTAARLGEQAAEILRRWDQCVRAEIPASREQQPLVLQNNLGQLLGEVARALSPTGEADATIAGLTLSQDHGGHRAELPGYRIDEVF